MNNPETHGSVQQLARDVKALPPVALPTEGSAPLAGESSVVDGEENLTSDEKHDLEIRRWQDEIRDLLIRLTGAPESKVDGGACESGDPLDLTLAEISAAINWLKDQQELSGASH